jgi:hypothetical protein
MVMSYGKAFSLGMITLSVLASLSYFAAKDYRRGVYWAASAVLITSVTF